MTQEELARFSIIDTQKFIRKIRVGFVGVGFLAVLVGMAAVLTLREAFQTKEHLISERIEPMILAQQMLTALERKVATTRGFIISPEQIALSEIRESHEEYQTLLARLKAVPGVTEPQQLAELGRLELAHHGHVERGIEMRQNRHPLSGVFRYFQQEIIPLHLELSERLGAVLAENEEAYRVAAAASSQRVSRTITTMVVVLFIATALILVLIPLVNRMLSENLRVSLELQAAHDALVEANRLLERRVQERTVALTAANQELEAFSYAVSHDLRAPLRGVDGFSQALLEDFGEKLEPQAKEYLRRVRAGVQRMGRLIDDLLALSRLTRQELRTQEVKLSDIARSVVEELRASDSERNVQVQVDIQDVGSVQGDSGLLSAALENLLANAWKFTAKEPAARIEFGCMEAPTQEGASEKVYFVRDNGAGFDMAYVDKLFGAFQRLHGVSEFSGTGIGLATVRRIIHRHGGRVWAEGEVGKGATFYFTLGTPESSSQFMEARGKRSTRAA